MAKQSPTKGGTARIRFIMVDAELPEGDLAQIASITSAIQNAVKPATTIIQQRLPTPPNPALPDTTEDGQAELEGEAVEVEEGATATTQQRETRPRKAIPMKVLPIDIKSDPSFESFANKHAPKSDAERNLVVLAWFNAYRNGEAVTANHVYTCYRAMKWPSGSPDFGSTLRSLKKNQFVTSNGRGEYEINHIGIARVEKMGPAG